MRVAVIDLGTNTFHLLIGDYLEGGVRTVFKEKMAVQIGKNGISKGFITDDACERALNALKNFKKIIDQHQVDFIQATATSAVRNAKNGSELVTKIALETEIDIQVISGMEEAGYIYYGVKNALDIGSKPALIMDIGGGSIEFIIGNNEKILWKQSFEVGGQRLIDKFHNYDPIGKNEISNLKEYLDNELIDLYETVSNYHIDTLIGSSGTFDTLSDVYRVENGIEKKENDTELPLDFEEFRYIVKDLISRNREERLDIPGMIPMRVDMIVVAVLLVKHVVDKLKLTNIRVSSYALKEGLLLNCINELKEKHPIYKS